MSHNSKVTGLMSLGPAGQMDATLTAPCVERQLIEAYVTLPPPPILQPFLLSSPGENRWMKGATNEGPLHPPPPPLSPLSPPPSTHCLCVICRGPFFFVRGDRVDGPWRSQVTAACEPHLSSLPLITMAGGCGRMRAAALRRQ